MTHVVIDGFHFLHKNGTGIGSYARTLATSLGCLGCHVGVLYGQRVRVRGGGDAPLSLAAQIFGNEPERPRWARLLEDLPFLVGAAVGGRRCIRAIDVPVNGVDLSAFEPPLPPYDQVLNADGMFERAHRHFAMRRRLVEVELPGSCSVAHWTGPLPIRARRTANIHTLHDLIPLQFPHFVIDKDGRAAQLHGKVAQEADHIITVSETSKRHIVDLLHVREDRVSVTYQPVPNLPVIAREDAERLVETVYGGKPGEYALFLGAIEPKKNLKRLIEAFLLAGVEMPLLVAGPLGWLYKEELELLDAVGRQSRRSAISGELAGGALDGCIRQDQAPVRRLGYLPRRHAVALLQCARLLVFPSIYEGFGLPVLEAMQLGVPVLCSNVSSLREVAGEAAALVDPLDVSAMAREVRRLMNDQDMRAELARRGPLQAAKFGAASYRQRLAAAYRKVGVEIDATLGNAEASKQEVTSEHRQLSRRAA